MTDSVVPPAERAWLDEQIAYYRARAAEYDATSTPPPTDARAEQGATLRAALDRFRPAGEVLEIASGTGQWTVELLRHPITSITAVDSSREMLDLARLKVGDDPRVTFIEGDVFSWEPPRRYDVVAFANFLSHVPLGSFEAFWDVVEHALSPTGRVFFVDERADMWRRLRWSGLGLPLEDREVSDGRVFRAVKIYWDPTELEARLSSLGWDVSITATGDAFYWGEGTAAH